MGKNGSKGLWKKLDREAKRTEGKTEGAKMHVEVGNKLKQDGARMTVKNIKFTVDDIL